MAITDAYGPDIFTLVPKSQLSKRHFDIHPIWSEYYDYDEREEMKAAIGPDDDPIFPLQYETDFLGPDDAVIAGTFTAGAD